MTTTAITTETPTEATNIDGVVDARVRSGDPALEAIANTVSTEDLLDDVPESPPCEMKFMIKQDDLLRVLTLVMKAISSRSTLPVLSHVLVATRPSVLEGMPAQVMFTCSNLETSISFQCDAEVERAGAFTIPAKALLECVKTFSKGKRITMEVVELRVHVLCGKRIFKLKGGMDASSFPAWNEMILAEGTPFALDADILRQAIKEVQFAAANDDAYPVLTTICMHIQEDDLTLVAADRFRMAVRTITLPTKIGKRDTRVLIPMASMRLLAEILPLVCSVVVQWNTERTQAVFQAGSMHLSTRLVEGTYPNYRTAIPKATMASFTAPRKDLDQIVKAFKPFAQDNSNIFTLTYKGEQGTVGCLAESEDLGEAYDEIDVPIEGADGHIIFNIRYLIDVLKYVPVDAFVFKLTTEEKPGLIIPLGREDYFLVLMPMSHKR